MQTKQYQAYITKIVLFLLVIIVLLSLFLYFRGPHVRLVSFSQDITKTSYTKGVTLTLGFDRPIKQQDYGEFVSVSPATTYSLQTGNQAITLTFQESLLSDTEYTIGLKNGVYDQSGKRMDQDFTYKFKSGPSSLIYLDRDSLLAEEEGHDVIFKRTLGDDESKEIYSHQVIRGFAANNEYIAVAVAEEQSDNDRLVVVNLKTKAVTEPQLYNQGRILQLEIPVLGNNVLFTTAPDLNSESAETYEQTANLLSSYNIDTGSLSLLTDDTDNVIRATNVSVSKDGQIALIRDDNYDYYAVSPFNDYDPVLLGSNNEDFGFAKSDTEVIFRNNNAISTYDLSSSEVADRNIDGDAIIQQIDYNSNKLLILKTKYEFKNAQVTADSISTIYSFSDWTNNEKIVWQEEKENNEIVRRINPSYDSSIVAIEMAQEGCTYENIGINSECKESKIKLVGTDNKNSIGEFAGIYPTWLP